MNFILLAIVYSSVVFTSCKTANIHLASDAKTHQYIGVVQNEIRDFETKEIIYYEIGNGKQLIRKLPQEINIYEP
jgi:hypothetical protein